MSHDSPNIPHIPNIIDRWFGALNSTPLLPETRPIKLARAIMLVLSVTLFFFIGWAAVTDVREVASSPGQVMPSGHVQVIQHLEGGMVREILVHEGDVVNKDQLLMKLDPTSATSDLNQLKQQQLTLDMEAERNRALIEGRQPDFSSFTDATPQMIADQQKAFASTMQAKGGEADVIRAQIAQREQSLKASQAQAVSLQQNLAIAEEGLDIKKQLYDKGYASRLSYLDKQEAANNMRGQYSSLQRDMERTRSEISEYQSRLSSADHDRVDQAHQELARIENERAKNAESIAKYSDRVNRLEVRAPVRGIVKGIEVTTIGGIVAPGAKLMEIVPLDTSLNVESRIRPQDVGALHPGLPVRVRVQAFDYTRYGGVDGTLHTVSATTFVDPTDGQNYYKGVIGLNHSYVGNDPKLHLLVPGMTVDADIITGQRSLLGYLLKPIRNAADTAFQER